MATIVTRETTQTDGTSPKGSPLTNAEVDTNFINLNDDKVEVSGAIIFEAQAGEALAKGDVVYVSGVSGNTPVVSKADADDANKMPAYGLAEDAANLNAAVNVVTFGTLYELDTSSFSAGDTVYVSTTAGSLTTTKPSGESSLIQNVGTVIRSHASAGSIKVGGAGRTNDTPNLDDGNVFIGNASNQAVARALTGDDISGGTITSFASTGIDDNATSTAITISSAGETTFGGDVTLSEAVPAIEWVDSDVTDSLVRFVSTGSILYQRIRGGTSSYGEFRWQRTTDNSTYLDTLRIPANGDIVIHDDTGAQAFRWDASTSRVGIGVQSPLTSLHVNEGDVGAFTPLARNVATFERSGAAYINLIASNIASTGIDFGDPDDVDAGGIRFDNADNSFAFRIADDEKVRINSSGNLLIDRTDDTLGGGNGHNLQIGSGSAAAGLTIHSGTSDTGDIQFADGTTGNASYRGLIRYLHSLDALDFWTAGTQRIRIDADGETSFFGGGVSLAKIGNIGPSNNSAIRISRSDSTVTNGNPLGYLEFGSNDATGSADTSFAYVSAEAEGAFNDGDNPTALAFGVTPDGSGAVAEAMRITNAGELHLYGGVIDLTDQEDPSLSVSLESTGTLGNGGGGYASALTFDGQLQYRAMAHLFADDTTTTNGYPDCWYLINGGFSWGIDSDTIMSVDGTDSVYEASAEHSFTVNGVEELRITNTETSVFGTSGDIFTLVDTNLVASASNIGNVRIAWDDSAGTRAAYVGPANSSDFFINNQYGSVKLTSAGSTKLTTVSAGIDVTGSIEANGAIISNGSGAGNAMFQLEEVGNNPWNIMQYTGGDFSIQYNGTSTSLSSLCILTDGKVGLGTTNPQRELQINLDSTTTTTLGEKGGIEFFSPSSTAGNGGEITWSGGSGNTERYAAISGDITTNTVNGSAGEIHLCTKGADTDTGLSSRVRVLGSGRVFISENTDTTMGGFGTEPIAGMAIYPDAGFTVIQADTTNTALYVTKTSAASGNYVNFATSGTTRGAIVEQGANIGIRFGSSSSAAHTLDDYEEGTWTVYIYDASTGGNQSSAGANAYYTKIGRLVMVNFYGYNNINTSGMTSGNVAYFNLPFTVGSNGRAVGVVNHHGWTYAGSASGRTAMMPRASQNSSRGYFTANGNGLSDANVVVSDIGSGADDIVDFTFWYWTDS